MGLAKIKSVETTVGSEGMSPNVGDLTCYGTVGDRFIYGELQNGEKLLYFISLSELLSPLGAHIGVWLSDSI